MAFRIGELARRTGTSPPTIRYYEEIGLLPAPARRPGGQRCYGEADRRRLAFIRQCREFGFSIEQVRALVALTREGDRPCSEARDMAAAQLAAVRRKRLELRSLERNLADFIARCDAACLGGAGRDCVILKDMAPKERDSRRPSPLAGEGGTSRPD